jgi:hypothetical protein
MSITWQFILYLIAFVLLVLQALGISRWISFGWAGLALVVFTAYLVPAA